MAWLLSSKITWAITCDWAITHDWFHMAITLQTLLTSTVISSAGKTLDSGYILLTGYEEYTIYGKIIILYILLKALPWVRTENTVWEGVSKDKYNTRQSRVLYWSQDMLSSVFFRTHEFRWCFKWYIALSYYWTVSYYTVSDNSAPVLNWR